MSMTPPSGRSKRHRSGSVLILKTWSLALLDVWLDTRLGMAMTHYWRDEPDQIPALMAEVRPVFDTEGVRRGRHARYYKIRRRLAASGATSPRRRADARRRSTNPGGRRRKR